MKRFVIILSCVAMFGLPLAGHSGGAGFSIETDASHNVFTGLFKSVWAKLNSISPQRIERPIAVPVATAGIRGSSSTANSEHLYWKNDHRFKAEIADYQAAQASLNRGNLEAAVSAFDGFLERYPQSNLRPNAMLGRGMGLAGLGYGGRSIAGMQQFVDEYPRHQLADDARQLIATLRAEGFVAAAPTRTVDL